MASSHFYHECFPEWNLACQSAFLCKQGQRDSLAFFKKFLFLPQALNVQKATTRKAKLKSLMQSWRFLWLISKISEFNGRNPYGLIGFYCGIQKNLFVLCYRLRRSLLISVRSVFPREEVAPCSTFQLGIPPSLGDWGCKSLGWHVYWQLWWKLWLPEERSVTRPRSLSQCWWIYWRTDQLSAGRMERRNNMMPLKQKNNKYNFIMEITDLHSWVHFRILLPIGRKSSWLSLYIQQTLNIFAEERI